MGLMGKWLVDYFDNSLLGIIFDIVVKWKYIIFCFMIYVCYFLLYG